MISIYDEVFCRRMKDVTMSPEVSRYKQLPKTARTNIAMNALLAIRTAMSNRARGNANAREEAQAGLGIYAPTVDLSEQVAKHLCVVQHNMHSLPETLRYLMMTDRQAVRSR